MKKGLYLFAALLLATFSSSHAQSFNVMADTIYYSTDGYYSLLNNVTNYTSGDIILQWHEVGNNFPLGLQLTTCLCDNIRCNHDSTFFIGGHYESVYPSGHGEMHLMGDVTGLTASGPFYLSLRFNNRAAPLDVDTTTFVINKLTLGMNSLTSNSGVSIFPNPATEKTTISIHAEKSEETQVRIIDMTGKAVFTSVQQLHSGDNAVDVSLQGIMPGMYSVVISAGNHIVSRKFIVGR